jgi:hypothetical protein
VERLRVEGHLAERNSGQSGSKRSG